MALRPLSRKAACCATVAASLRLHARYIQKCRFWIFCKSTVCEVFKTDTGNSRRAAHENKHLTLSFFSCNFIELLKRFAWKNSLSQIPFAKFDHKIVTILPLLFPDAFCRKVGQQFCTTVYVLAMVGHLENVSPTFAQMFNRITNAQFSTSAPILPIPC